MADDDVDALVEVALTVTAIVSRVAADHDLSLSVGRLLGILRDRTPRMADLAAHLGLERSTMSGLVARAETRGLVARTTDADDGRAARISLTAEGRRIADEGHARVVAELAPALSRLDGPEQRRLAALLRRLLGDATSG